MGAGELCKQIMKVYAFSGVSSIRQSAPNRCVSSSELGSIPPIRYNPTVKKSKPRSPLPHEKLGESLSARENRESLKKLKQGTRDRTIHIGDQLDKVAVLRKELDKLIAEE
jgi:hypothetical protein